MAAADSAAQSAAQFTQAFYDWYRRHADRFETAIRDKPAVFAPELLTAMRADIQAQARSPDYIVGLDWDPFLATQDPCEPYRVGQVTRRGDTILVAVKGMCTDMEPREGPDVIAEVGGSAAHWVFLNFRHVRDRGSLLQDLSDLRQARESDSVRHSAQGVVRRFEPPRNHFDSILVEQTSAAGFRYSEAYELAIRRQPTGLSQVLGATVHTDGVGADDQAQIVWGLLRLWGDSAFTAVLRQLPPHTQAVVRCYLDYSADSSWASRYVRTAALAPPNHFCFGD